MIKLPVRTIVVVAIDVFMTALALVIAYALLHGVGHLSLLRFKVAAVMLAGLALVVYPSYGLYRNLWRYVSIFDLSRLAQASVFVIAMFYGLWWCLGFPSLSPASSYPIIHLMVLLFCLGGPRVLRRALADPALRARLLDKPSEKATRSILLISNPAEAELFIRSQSLSSGGTAFDILGIVDPSGEAIGRAIHGVKILGTPADLNNILENMDRRPQRLGVSASAFTSLPDDFEAICATYGLALSQLPDPGELQEREDAGRLLKPIAIEDILGRSQQVINLAPVGDMLTGQVVLVTGAGGSIGSELVRQIASLKPAKLILLEQSEVGLYHIDRECNEKFPDLTFDALLADVREENVVDGIFAKYKPAYVFHAAALKHVPIVEAQPYEGVQTNVKGTKIVASTAAKYNARAFVLISTDKAVSPSSMMGATKRIAEMVVQEMDRAGHATRFFSVRFGNVLGSSGSVVPLFRHQIARGGPVTVTHPDMTRFFMTIREAVGLVLQAAVEGLKSDKRGSVYVLDMGRPVRILDVARQMIRLAGLEPDKDIVIETVGLRPGEKLHEALFCDHETPGETGLGSVREAQAAQGAFDLKPLLDGAAKQDSAAVVAALQALIPDAQINA